MENAMTDLTPEDRALLERARDGHEPTDNDRVRVRVALLTRLGVGTGLVTTTAATSKAATTVLLTKILATVAIAGAVGGASVVTYRATRPAQVHRVAGLAPKMHEISTRAPELAGTSEAVARELVVETETFKQQGAPATNQGPATNETTTTQPAPSSAPHIAEPIARPPVDSPSPLAAWPVDSPEDAPQEPVSTSPPDLSTSTARPVQLTPTTLEAETRLVRAGVAALHAGDAARALALFDEHARAFPDGALSEERTAERVVALGELHRCDEARAVAALFLRNHPRSPSAARVHATCAETRNP
jgi:hypothetical protein